MKFIFVLLFSTLFFIDFSQSQFKNVQLPRPKLAKYEYSQCEPSIAINSNKPNQLIAGSLINDYYFSQDTGKTWISTSIKSKLGVWGDPVLMFDKHDAAYYFHLSTSKKAHLDKIICQRAKSFDANFSNGSFPKPNGKKAQDKHWYAYDSKNDVIYLTWTQFDKYGSNNTLDSSIILFSKSSDKAKTWSIPQRISKFAGDCLDSDNTVEGAVPAVGPNGELYVTWTGPKGLVFQCSKNQGETWLLEEKIIGNQFGGWDLNVPGINRCNGLPILHCDTSNSKFRGRLYLNWADQRNGEDNTDIFLSYSDNQGETWANPVKVNQDNSKKHQFFTWMAIDQINGNLFFVYFDRRNYDDLNTDVYISYSKNGGETFEDQRISEIPFVPNDKIFFGDYNNIAVHNGIIRPIWPRMDQGKITLWTALVNFK